jgi:ADP-ribose pyrophosphatase
MQEHGPWKIVQQRPIYRDPWIDVRVDDVIRPDGRPGIHSVIQLKPGVSVLALDHEGHVFLTEEFHYAVGRVTLETVSGGRDADEEPRAAAERELREELGIVADQWTDLGMVDPFTSNVVSPTGLFLAEGLRFVSEAPEGTELIRRVRVPFAEAAAMAWDGRITHAPSCVLILKAWCLKTACGLARGR